MSSPLPDGDPAGDPAPVRIRTAAIDRFGRDGFEVGLRQIAASAGVSLGLIRHHFGSKEELRRACDEQILSEIREAKSTQLLGGDPAATLLRQLATVESLGPVWRYLVQTLRGGGDLARRFVDGLVEDAVDYMTRATEEGVLVPSRDPAARARFLALAMLGGAVLFSAIEEGTDPHEGIRAWTEQMTGPALELYTHGLLADSSMYDAWVQGQERPPPDATSSAGPSHP